MGSWAFYHATHSALTAGFRFQALARTSMQLGRGFLGSCARRFALGHVGPFGSKQSKHGEVGVHSQMHSFG